MLPLRTLVVALDLSPGSEPALAQAIDLATRSGAALHLLHADVLFQSTGEGLPSDAAPGQALRQRVRRFAATALGPADAGLEALDPTVAVVRDLAAPAAILRYVAEVKADLLVMGTHGRAGVARLLLGSVAEACVAAAPCPVLTVRRRTEPPASHAPVLAAIDFSERSRAVLEAGRELAGLFDTNLALVHVVRGAGPYPGVAPSVLSLADVDPDEAEAVRLRLTRFAEGVPGPSPNAIHVAMGAPSRVLAGLAAERGARMLVMGTNARSGVARAILGSVAEATLRRASCPVLTLHRAVRSEEPPRPAPSSDTP